MFSTGAQAATLSADATAPLPELAIDNLSHLRLRAPVEWLYDTERRSFDAIREADFKPLQASHVNRGVDDGVYWLRVRLVNPTATGHRWVLHHETSYLDHFTIHYRDQEAAWQTIALSDREPFYSRPLATPKLAWAHTTPANSHTDLYLRLNQQQADALTLNVDLWEARQFQRNLLYYMLLSGIYYGMLLFILLVTLCAALLLKQWLWLSYGMVVVFTTLTWAAIQGLTFQFLWPASPLLHNQGFHLIFLGLALSALQFSKGFLRTAELVPRLHRLLSILQIGMLMAVALRFAGIYEPVLFLSYAALGMVALILPPLGWYAWRRGVSYARWYALAWSIYSVSLIASLTVATSGLLPWGMTPLYFSQLAGLLEALLLLAAMGESLKEWDRERRAALQAALQDALTGLGNRRRLQQAFGELQQRRSRDGQPWFIAVLDLDNFKAINDTYGHAAGDHILQQFAQLLAQHTRPEDVCIRYGGEEFAVLFQAHSPDEALRIIDRIRVEFAAHPTRYDDQLITHTFSAGIALLATSGALPLSAIMRRADDALYVAKSGGRNQVGFATEPAASAAPAVV